MATMTQLAMQPLAPSFVLPRRMYSVSQPLPLRTVIVGCSRLAAQRPLVSRAAFREYASPARLDEAEADAPPAAPNAQTFAQPQIDAMISSTDSDEGWPRWWQFGHLLAKGALVVFMAAALALMPFSSSALAARSSGRMGGSSFSSARSSGGSSYGGSSYGGGGYSGSRSFAPSGGGGDGYMGRSYSAPSVTVAPQTSFGFGGFGYGGYYGQPMMGAPVVQSSGGGGGGGLIALLGLGFLAFVLYQAVLAPTGDDDGMRGGKATVAKVQVALTGNARSLQRELERIAKRADTNTSEGLHFVLQETVLALLRHPEYCEYGVSASKGVRGLDAAEERFNEASMTERGKYQEETLSNVGGRSRNTSGGGRWDGRGGSRGPGDELIVVTILVATDGSVDIPKVNSQDSLRTALNRLGGLRSDQVLAVEVIWTPQDDGDSYTRDDMMLEFPKMVTL